MKDRKFVRTISNLDEKTGVWTDTQIEVDQLSTSNGWDCEITPNGSVICECARDYSDGWHTIQYRIAQNGFARLTLETPEGKKTLRKGFVVPKGTPFGNGLIGLAGGNVDSRYAYFRDSSFQDFLDRTGITAVSHADPNQRFSYLNRYNWGTGDCWMKVWSDGHIDQDFKESSSGLGDGTSIYTVSGATWAVVETKNYSGNNRSHAVILYTLEKDVTSLEEDIRRYR